MIEGTLRQDPLYDDEAAPGTYGNRMAALAPEAVTRVAKLMEHERPGVQAAVMIAKGTRQSDASASSRSGTSHSLRSPGVPNSFVDEQIVSKNVENSPPTPYAVT